MRLHVVFICIFVCILLTKLAFGGCLQQGNGKFDKLQACTLTVMKAPDSERTLRSESWCLVRIVMATAPNEDEWTILVEHQCTKAYTNKPSFCTDETLNLCFNLCTFHTREVVKRIELVDLTMLRIMRRHHL